jgi:hypothetical protein
MACLKVMMKSCSNICCFDKTFDKKKQKILFPFSPPLVTLAGSGYINYFVNNCLPATA